MEVEHKIYKIFLNRSNYYSKMIKEEYIISDKVWNSGSLNHLYFDRIAICFTTIEKVKVDVG